MNIPKPLKIALLLITLWIPLYMVGFMFMVGTMSMIDFDLLMTLHLGTMAAMAITTLFYVVHLFKTRSVPDGKKALWGLALFCGGPIAMPIYFFNHVWPEAAAWPEIVEPRATL